MRAAKRTRENAMADSAINRTVRSLASAARDLALVTLVAGCTERLIVQRSGGPTSRVPESEVLGDGTPASVDIVTLFEPPPPYGATDLDFNPARPGELWAVMRQPHPGTPCNQPLPGSKQDPSCALYRGRVAILSSATGPSPETAFKEDPNAWHFMRLPTAVAFGGGDTFATCGEARTGNWDNDLADFNGPVLWSSSPSIFAIQPPGMNGSHLDMLHATPFCMGIEHERDNVYWAFNGQIGALDRYDFHEPHQPGGEDHSDGEAWRWALGEVTRFPGVPSHLAIDPEKRFLYVVDTGGARVIRVDLESGTEGELMGTDDVQLPYITRIDGAAIVELVATGVLERPSGIALNGKTMLVTDNATSRIHMFDLDGRSLRSLETGFPSGTLAGVAVGPDGKVYFVDLQTGAVRRIDLASVTSDAG
jgi:hypothetical protein